MNKKIIILISCLSVSGIFYFSWKIISKNNPRPIVQQKKKNEQQKKNKDSPKIIRNDQQKNNHFLLWIIIGIIVLIGIGIIIYVFFKKKKEKEYLSSQELFNILNNNKFTTTDQQIFNIHIDNLKNNNNIKNWQCGAKIVNGKVQIILLKEFSRDFLFSQLWHSDIEEKYQDPKTPQFLKNIYKKFEAKDIKEEIKRFFNLTTDILQIINGNFLEQINEKNVSNCQTLKKMVDAFRQGKNKKDELIVLTEIDTAQVGEKINESDFDNKNALSLFGKAMNALKPLYYETTEHIFLEHFFNLFNFTYDLISQLKTYLNNCDNQENQETIKKLDDINRDIFKFLN